MNIYKNNVKYNSVTDKEKIKNIDCPLNMEPPELICASIEEPVEYCDTVTKYDNKIEDNNYDKESNGFTVYGDDIDIKFNH